MPDFLNALKEAATNPLSYVAYLAVVLAWTLVSLRNQRISTLLKRIDSIPERDRLRLLQLEMKAVPPPRMTAEQWLRSQRTQYVFFGVAASIAALVVLGGLVAWTLVNTRPPDPMTQATQQKQADAAVTQAGAAATQAALSVTREPGVNAPGKLRLVSVKAAPYEATGGAAIDVYVYNDGGSTALITEMRIRVLEAVECPIKGFLPPSQIYDADISLLRGPGDVGVVQLSQVVAPGQADRFLVKISADFLGTIVKSWALELTLKGANTEVASGPIQLNLPQYRDVDRYPVTRKATSSDPVPPPTTLIGIPAGTRPHIVVWGETLTTLATAYGVSEQSLQLANGFSDRGSPMLGQAIVVPGSEPVAEPLHAPNTGRARPSGCPELETPGLQAMGTQPVPLQGAPAEAAARTPTLPTARAASPTTVSTPGRVVVTSADRGAPRVGRPPDRSIKVGPVVRTIALSPDGQLVAVGGCDGKEVSCQYRSPPPHIDVFETSTGAPSVSLEPPGVDGDYRAVNSIDFSDDGALLALSTVGHVTASNWYLHVWDVAHRKWLGAGTSLPGQPRLAFVPDGGLLAVAPTLIDFWDVDQRVASRPQLSQFADIGELDLSRVSALNTVAASRDGALIAVGAKGTAVWNTRTQRWLTSPLAGSREIVSSLAFSPNGRVLAIANRLATPLDPKPLENTYIVSFWDVDRETQVGPRISGASGTVWSMKYSPDGARLMLASDTGIRTIDTQSGKQIGASEAIDADASDGWTAIVERVASGQRRVLSGDGRVLATMRRNPDRTRVEETIQVWDLHQPLMPLEAGKAEITFDADDLPPLADLRRR